MPSVNLGKLQINYAVQGTGEPFLLFPDNLFSFQAYPHEIETLSKRYQVIVFDYPGLGQSTHAVLYPDEREVDLWGFLDGWNAWGSQMMSILPWLRSATAN